MPEATDLLHPAAFEERLRAAIAPYRFEETRLHAALGNPRLGRRIAASMAQSTLASATQFLSLLAALIETAPDAGARLALLENLLEEEGLVLKSSGIAIRPQQRHIALAERFTQACGVDEAGIGEGMDMTAISRRTFGLVAKQHWIEAASFLLIGNELKAGEACPVIVTSLLALGFTPHEVAFFEVHIDADMQHGRQAIDMVTRLAQTRREQDAAIAAAAEGAAVWFESYGGSQRKPAAAAA